MDFKESKEKIWLENEEGKTVAFVEFPEFEPGKVEVTHTVVDKSMGGRGIAGKLMEAMAKMLSADGRKAELTCSYASAWFDKHREYDELLIDPAAEHVKAKEIARNACQVPKHPVNKSGKF